MTEESVALWMSTLTFNLDSEVRLSTTNSDRERLDELATLYGLIVSLDYLERAYVRDSIDSKQFRQILLDSLFFAMKNADVKNFV